MGERKAFAIAHARGRATAARGAEASSSNARVWGCDDFSHCMKFRIRRRHGAENARWVLRRGAARG
jgi:hypothetical protein